MNSIKKYNETHEQYQKVQQDMNNNKNKLNNKIDWQK